MMKAIKVTSDNKTQLEQQYDFDKGYLEFSSGLYIVSKFGGTMCEGLFTKAVYDNRFVETGKKLENGYVEVVPK